MAWSTFPNSRGRAMDDVVVMTARLMQLHSDLAKDAQTYREMFTPNPEMAAYYQHLADYAAVALAAAETFYSELIVEPK